MQIAPKLLVATTVISILFTWDLALYFHAIFLLDLVPDLMSLWGPTVYSVPLYLKVIFLAAAIISFGGYLFLGLVSEKIGRTRPENNRWLKLSVVGLGMSFLLASSLHQFIPFRVLFVGIPDWMGPVDYWGIVLTWFGALFSIFLLSNWQKVLSHLPLYFSLLALMCLVPSDSCSNFFNTPWLYRMGASPLMFVPSAVIAQCCFWVWKDVYPRMQIILIGTINLGLITLGVGHWTRWIW